MVHAALQGFFSIYFRELAGTRLSLKPQGAPTVRLPELGPRLQSPLGHLYSLHGQKSSRPAWLVLSPFSSHIPSMKNKRGPQNLTGWGVTSGLGLDSLEKLLSFSSFSLVQLVQLLSHVLLFVTP